MNSANDIDQVDCPICGPSPTKVRLDDGKPTKYVQCRICKTVYASPRASRKERYAWLDKTFSLSDAIFALTDSRLPALKYEANIIQSYSNSGRILDVGCSIGVFLDLFPSSKWERYGVEISPSAAEYAAQTYDIQVHTGSFSSTSFPDNYFSSATMIDTLYYLDDPLADFQELARILKPGGIFAIEVAGQAYMLNRNYGLASYLLDRRWSRASSDSSYLFWFNPMSLTSLLNKCGFEILSWHVVPSPQRSSIFMSTMIRAHFSIASLLVKISYRTLSWAPKYLCVSQKASP